jgi:aspartyl-tRNA(Asn)/glutamyl-tRNA(Gln) amidotransferase subunit C
MPVDIDIAKVAKLARLALSAEELETLGAELGDILEHAERVQALPTEGVPPTSHPLPMVNAFREDEIGECLDRESFLAEAPDAAEGQFRVPRILA